MSTVHLDLDHFQRDPDDEIEPFTVVIGGREIVMTNPDELTWDELSSVYIPADFLRVVMSRDDRRHVNEAKLQAWQFRALMDAYSEHYRLAEKMENFRADQRRQSSQL